VDEIKGVERYEVQLGASYPMRYISIESQQGILCSWRRCH